MQDKRKFKTQVIDLLLTSYAPNMLNRQKISELNGCL